MTSRAFIWTPDEGMQDLGWIAGALGLRAWSINDRGEVVGIVTFPDGPQDGFLYDPNQGLTLLSSLTPDLDGWTLQETHQINDRGEIVGTAVYRDGARHAFELVPEGRSIPEPSTVLLVLEACAVALQLVGGLSRQHQLPEARRLSV
jgi:hypothetical protein